MCLLLLVSLAGTADHVGACWWRGSLSSQLLVVFCSTDVWGLLLRSDHLQPPATQLDLDAVIADAPLYGATGRGHEQGRRRIAYSGTVPGSMWSPSASWLDLRRTMTAVDEFVDASFRLILWGVGVGSNSSRIFSVHLFVEPILHNQEDQQGGGNGGHARIWSRATTT
jgi:hypothetical protein